MDIRNDRLYAGEALSKIFGEDIPDHIVPVPDEHAKEADYLLKEREYVDVDMTADTPFVNWAKSQKKTYAWIARYKGVDGCAIVIDTTPANAKARFHEAIHGGELKDVRLTDQVSAENMVPDVITSSEDPRFKQLGYKPK